MAVDDPWAIDGLPMSALEWRRAMSGLLLHSSTGAVSAIGGVLSGCTVTVSGSTATVGAGQMVITPQAGVNGSYLLGLTDTTLTVAVRDATYSRVDRIIARVYDADVDGSGQSKGAVEIITGTPAALPVPAALPSGTVELAQLQVPSSAGGAIVVVDRRWRNTAAGGVPWFVDIAARDLYLASPLVGQLCVTGSGVGQTLWLWTSTAWVAIWTPPATISLSGLFVAGTANQAPAATRDGVWVQLEGGWQMQAGVAPATPAIDYNVSTVLLTLPSGWRPVKQLDFPAVGHSSAALMTASVRVQTSGAVEVRVNNGGAGTTTANFTLSAVRFRIS